MRSKIVTRKDTDGLARMEDLKGKAVGVLSATVASGCWSSSGVDMRIYPGKRGKFCRPQAKPD